MCVLLTEPNVVLNYLIHFVYLLFKLLSVTNIK